MEILRNSALKEMNRTVLIAGTHPMLEDVARQFAEHDWKPEFKKSLAEAYDCPEEIFIATECGQEGLFTEDSRNLNDVRRICSGLENRRVRCHILLHSNDTLALFQTQDPCSDIRDKVDVIPFTLETLWAQKIFTGIPGEQLQFPPMDRELISRQSDRTVHIVMFGMNSMTETLARYAALTCHYPDYCRDHSLRTRITLVDEDMKSKMNGFVNRHQALFDNSFYRLIDLDRQGGSAVSLRHAPIYDGIREDFVDIEWEFVHGSMHSSTLRDKLSSWASSQKQDLTVFLNHCSDDRNINNFMQMPRTLADNGVNIIVRTCSNGSQTMYAGRRNVWTYGQHEHIYDITTPLISLAKMVNHVYDCCYNDNFSEVNQDDNVYAPVSIDMAEAEAAWNRLPADKRWSSIHNAMTIPVKMRSLGHDASDWNTFYSLSAREISTLAETEHNRWNIETLMKGFIPVNEQQEKEIENDISLKSSYKKNFIHYDLRAYKDLRADSTGKRVDIYDICLSASIPLIASTFIKERSHE